MTSCAGWVGNGNGKIITQFDIFAFLKENFSSFVPGEKVKLSSTLLSHTNPMITNQIALFFANAAFLLFLTSQSSIFANTGFLLFLTSKYFFIRFIMFPVNKIWFFLNAMFSFPSLLPNGQMEIHFKKLLFFTRETLSLTFKKQT